VSLSGQLVASGVRVVLALGDDTAPVAAALRAGVRVVIDPDEREIIQLMTRRRGHAAAGPTGSA
jgi:hypothetical protein